MVSESVAVNVCLKALSDPTRLAIVTRLNEGELSVHEVAEQFPMSRPAISKHLKILREAGLVAERSEGRERIYTIDASPLRGVRDWLRQFGAARSIDSGSSPRIVAAAHQRKYVSPVGSSSDWRVW